MSPHPIETNIALRSSLSLQRHVYGDTNPFTIFLIVTSIGDSIIFKTYYNTKINHNNCAIHVLVRLGDIRGRWKTLREFRRTWQRLGNVS